MASWLLAALLGATTTADCLEIDYAENGKPRRARVSLLATVGQERIQFASCTGGVVVPPEVAAVERVTDVEVRVRGRVLQLGSLPAESFLRVFRWEVGVHRPPFKAMREDVDAQERAQGRRVEWVHTFTPQSKDGDPVVSTTYVFSAKPELRRKR